MAIKDKDLITFRRTRAEFEALPSYVNGALYFISDEGLILLYDEETGFEPYGGGSSTSNNLDGGRADEVYQQDDIIDGGGA
jgi:hypothetical protein